MAVLLEQIMPEGVSLEMIDEVTAEMGVAQDMPRGAVVHTHFLRDGRVRVVDVWDSVDDYEAFAKERLGPALQKVAERNGASTDGPGPETTITEVHGFLSR